ncbi:MAG: 2-oxo acid dehydrogenase subunit E2 [Oscillospiraceae bacterium]|nr:2-oxo acid dehydrogenase subunit E2 [Oscillospiraceae bacterium]
MPRKDGKRFKGTDMMYTIAPHIMDKRCDACNSLTVYIPYEPMHDYIVKKRAEGIRMSHMSLIISAYVRTVAKFPAVNRFVVNKRIYSRNDLIVAMVVQRAVDAQSTMAKLSFELTDTIFDVNDKINSFIDANRQEDSNKTDDIMRKLTKFAFLLGPVVSLLKWLDKHGLLPKAVIDASPFHTSMVISNLASIRTNHIFHHIYDFGTVGQIITLGNSELRPTTKKGEVVFERNMPLGVVCDERIASGGYYAKCFHEMERYLANPELLEAPPEVVNTDF